MRGMLGGRDVRALAGGSVEARCLPYTTLFQSIEGFSGASFGGDGALPSLSESGNMFSMSAISEPCIHAAMSEESPSSPLWPSKSNASLSDDTMSNGLRGSPPGIARLRHVDTSLSTAVVRVQAVSSSPLSSEI